MWTSPLSNRVVLVLGFIPSSLEALLIGDLLRPYLSEILTSL